MRNAHRLVLCLALVLAACGGPPGTPAEAYAALRAIVASGDAKALYALCDDESASFHRGQVREWRALLDRGDDPAVALKGAPLTAEELRGGTEVDAAALLISRRNPLTKQSKWYLDATVVAEESESETTAKVRLRGPDGTERDMWFVRQHGSWHYDHYRTVRPW